MRAEALARPFVLPAPRWRAVAAGIAVLGLAAGFLVTPAAEQAASVRAAGPELTALLRMMAGLKLAFVAAGLGFAWWRLGSPAGPAKAAAYVAAVGGLCLSPGLIWDMAHVVAGAALLHGGLIAIAALGWTDRRMCGTAMAAALRRRTAFVSGSGDPI